jgi:hypothetical protein
MKDKMGVPAIGVLFVALCCTLISGSTGCSPKGLTREKAAKLIVSDYQFSSEPSDYYTSAPK